MGMTLLNGHIHNMVQVSLAGGDYDIPENLRDGFYIGGTAGNVVFDTVKGNTVTVPVAAFTTMHVKATKIYQSGTTAAPLFVLSMEM